LAKKLQGKKVILKDKFENSAKTKEQDFLINYNKCQLLKNKP